MIKAITTRYLESLKERRAAGEVIADLPSRIGVIRRLLAADGSKEKLLQGDEKLAQAFLRISRVASAEPVMLFGQPVPSMAHNRIEIALGKDDPVTGDRIPGDVIFSGLMTEAALTSLFLSTGRAENDSYVTAETVLGMKMGAYQPQAVDRMQGILDDLERSLRKGPNIVEEIRAKVSRAKLPLNKTQTAGLVQMCGDIDMSDSVSFFATTWQESKEQERVNVQMEASHTLVNIGRIIDAKQGLRIAGPKAETLLHDIEEQRLSNPMLNAFYGNYSPEEAAVLRDIVTHAIMELAHETGRDDYDLEADDAWGKKFKSRISYGKPGTREHEIEKDATSLFHLLNEVKNPHVLSGRASRTPWMLAAGLSRISGHTGGMHSDFALVGSEIMRITISTALQSNDYGRTKVRHLDELIALDLSPAEFLLAVRGHPDGEFVRCTMARCLGPIPEAPYVTRAELIRQDIKAEARKSNAGAFAAALSDVREALKSGITNKADQQNLLEKLDILSAATEDHGEKLKELFETGVARIEDQVEADLKKALTAISETAPEFGRLFLGGQSDPGPDLQ